MRPPPDLSLDAALFLDLDGTLAHIEARPDDVAFDAERAAFIANLEQALGGALAVISGRTLGDIDRILGGATRCVAAVHGLVRRHGDGGVTTTQPSPHLHRAWRALAALARVQPGLVVEDKGLSLAVHYRQAPEAQGVVDMAVSRILAGVSLVRQDGAMVCELRTPGPDKGEALQAFMREPPFSGRRPVMVGDDQTDEAAFAAAAAGGGYGVLVGPDRESAARYQLETVEAVRSWLVSALWAAAP